VWEEGSIELGSEPTSWDVRMEETMTGLPWKSVFWAIPLSLVAGAVLLGSLTLVLNVTLRRSLLGGIWEARLKDICLRYAWVLTVAVAGPVICMMREGLHAPAILTLLAAGAFALLRLPPVLDLVIWFTLAPELLNHLRNHSGELKQMERGSAPEEMDESIYNEDNWYKLPAKDRSTLEEMNTRLNVEAILQKAHRHSRVEELIDEAASHARMDMGIDLGGVTRFMEFVVLTITFLLARYVVLGLGLASKRGVDWGQPMLYSIVVALAVVAMIHAVSFIIRLRERKRLDAMELPCLMCGKKTSRRVNWGRQQPHFCSELCEQELVDFLMRVGSALREES
jgi:hypothetical protein